MSGKSVGTQEVLSLLRELPGRILTLTADLSPTQLQTKPQPEEWSANEILAHLRSCADVWGNCIRLILAEDMPTIRAINPTTWINQTDYPNLEFGSSLHFFTQQRNELVIVLEGLLEESWGRGALVTGICSSGSSPGEPKIIEAIPVHSYCVSSVSAKTTLVGSDFGGQRLSNSTPDEGSRSKPRDIGEQRASVRAFVFTTSSNPFHYICQSCIFVTV